MSKIVLTEENVANTPASGKSNLYVKTDGSLALRDDAGVESVILSDIVGDITPQLGGDLDANGKTFDVSSVRQITDVSLGTGTHTFNYANGDMQQLTATGDITLAFSNFVAGKVCGMIIDAINWGAHTITHPAGLLLAGGAAPSYTAAGMDRLLVTKDKDDVYSLTVIGQDMQA